MPTTDDWLRKHSYLKEGERAFQDVAEGEEFTTMQGVRHVRMPEGFSPDRPLANAQRIGPDAHLRASFGPWAAVREEKVSDSQAQLDERFLTQSPREIQRQLAARHRQYTGSIPRGQLWQPCEVPGCDNEPVCMNCFRCQEKHCHCFDQEE